MTDRDLAAEIARRALDYHDCAHDQALAYACEDLCERDMPSRPVGADDALDTVARLAHAEDLDPPRVTVSNRLRRTVGAADTQNRVIHLSGPVTPLLTVVHELAHFTSTSRGHGADFLHEMVRLTRVHVGVEHAAYLRRLYEAAGLAVPPWEATSRQPRPR